MIPNIKSVELAPGFTCYGIDTENALDELRGIYVEAFVEDTYFKNGITIPANATVLDVGANVGLFTLALKQRHPDARVHAFEPAPPSLRALRANLEHHKGAWDVIVHPVAVGRTDEESVTFSFLPNMPGNSTRYPEGKAFDKARVVAGWGHELGDHLYAEERVEVQIERLSTILRRHPEIERIDLLKIDVEGSELDVLAGLEERDWAKVQQIVMEVQDVDGALASVERDLATRGFSTVVETPESLADLHYRIVYAVRR